MEPAAKRVRSESDLQVTDGVSTAEKNLWACARNDAKCKTAAQVPVPIEADAAEDKGCRHTMEDAWVLLPDASSNDPVELRSAHFAIFDGHGGRQAVDFARTHLHPNVVSAGLPRELLNVKAAKKAIINGFKVTDEALLQESLAGLISFFV
ncbi:hypothetical protein L7F22_005993 [Adiantum nelumboides]|nr:hypothetical protein [Adiantum nelumboides]